MARVRARARVRVRVCIKVGYPNSETNPRPDPNPNPNPNHNPNANANANPNPQPVGLPVVAREVPVQGQAHGGAEHLPRHGRFFRGHLRAAGKNGRGTAGSMARRMATVLVKETTKC